ncbi:hypothetical protein ACTD5D_19365 [Nocardia takedensis]|uniref:hypothetical protein n=1 Tax=Nocardia takedensis TaxID=259390 RepID=UPI003F7779E2
MWNGPWLERTAQRGENGRLEHGPLRLFLPYEGTSNERWIRCVVGKAVPLARSRIEGVTVWELSANHLIVLATAMAERYGEIQMRLQMSMTTECSHSCQNALPETVNECVCNCGGRDHSGTGTYDDWYSAGHFRIEREDGVQIEHLQIRRGQIPVPASVPPAALSPQPPPLLLVIDSPPPEPTRPPEPARATVPRTTPPSGPESPQSTHQRAPTGDMAARTPEPESTHSPTTDPDPSPSTAMPPRGRGWTRPLVATAGFIAVATTVVWVFAPGQETNQKPPRSVTTEQPASDAPRPTPAFESTDPPETPAPTTPRLRGCFPFQVDC